jgi:acetyl-CoA acetyltransferase
MPTSMKNQAAVAGIGATAITRNSGVSELSLACEAISKCLDDAGLDPVEVDGLVTYTLETNDEVEVARAVGLGDLTMYAKINYGGGAAVGLVQQAVMAITSGAAKNVVIWRAMNGRSGQRMGQGVSGNIISSDLIHWSWYMAYGMLTPASWVSMIANKYMNMHGVTAEHLAEVAIAQRNFALNNPSALNYGKPLTLDEYMNSKRITESLRIHDCCLETDCGVALLVTSTERARDMRHKPAVIRGVTQASTRGQEQMTSFYREELDCLPEMEFAARRVYAMAGLGPDDIDATCLYDAFTPEVIMQLESFGFCKRGEAKDFVAAGNLRLGGRLPNNTHGGLLSESYAHGLNNVAEGVRLIRGTSCNQPDKVDHVLVSSGVGVPTGAVIFGRD